MRRFTAFLTVSGLLLALAPAALGADGDIAIFSEVTGDQTITTSVFDHTWDTILRDDSATYVLVGGPGGSGIELGETGHYLVMYSSRFDDQDGGNSASQRVEIQSNLSLGGTSLPVGWSQGFIRGDSGVFEAVTSGGGIISATMGDVLTLQSFRTDSTTAAARTIQRDPGNAGIQLVKLKESWDYLRLSQANDVFGPTSETFVDVTYDTQGEIDTGSFDHTAGTGDILLRQAGHYLVFANTYFQKPSNTTRTNFAQQLTVNGTLVEGSFTTVYERGNESTDDGAASIGMIIETTATDSILNIEVAKDDGSNPVIKGGRTAVTIVKLPDDADYIRLTDSTDQDLHTDSTTPLTWDIEDELDTDGFTHSGSQIGVTENDDYLFLTAFADQSDNEAQRAVPWVRWRENGSTFYNHASTTTYHRNSGGSHWAGNWTGLVMGMEAGDYIEATTEKLGTNSGTMMVEHKGLQGVRLGSLFPQPFSGYVSDELGDANWAEMDPCTGFSHWLLDDSPTSGYPTASDDAIIRTNTIRVAYADGNQAVLSCLIETGGLLIDPNTLLTAYDDVTVQMATLDINGTLSTDRDIETAAGATINIDGTLVAGSANIVSGASLTLTPNSTVTLPNLMSAGETTFGSGASGTIDVLDITDGNTLLPAAAPTITTINASGGILSLDTNVANLNVSGSGTVNTATPVTITNIDISGGLMVLGANADGNTLVVSGGELSASAFTLTIPTVTVSGGTVMVLQLVADNVTTSGTGELTVLQPATFVTADLGGTATFWNSLTTTGNTLNVTGGTTHVYGELSSPGVTVSGGSLTAHAALASPAVTVVGGSLTSLSTLTSDDVTVSGGSLTASGTLTSDAVTVMAGTLTANNTLMSDAVTVSGGTLVTNGALDTTSQILVNGGRWDAYGAVITPLADPNVALQISGGGAVYVYGASTLSGMDRIDVASDGGSSALNILTEQTGGWPVMITVGSGSLLFGDMRGAYYADDPNRNVLFEDKAVFGFTAGPSPTVADLEAMSGPGTRLTGAIVGNDANEHFEIGEGIYSGLAFGSWTAGPFMGDANSTVPFEIHTNGFGVGFQQPRFNLADANDIIRITGAGNFEWDIDDANSTARIFHREGPAGNIDTNVIRLGEPNDIPAGFTLRITNGMINKYNGVDATIIDPNGVIEIGENARLNNRTPFAQGTVRVLPGGIVVIDDAAELTSGTVRYEWDEDPNNPVNPKIALDTDTFDPAYTAGFPKAADIILMHAGRADRFDGTGIVLGQDCRLTGRSGGNVDLDAAGVSLKAADYTTRVRLSAPLSTDGTTLRNFDINVDVDLRWDDGDGNSGRASLIVGDTEDYVTVQGDTDNTPVLTPQIGNVYVNQNTWTDNVTVLSGLARFNNTSGTSLYMTGALTVEGGRALILNQGASLADGTLAPGGMFVEDDGQITLSYNAVSHGKDLLQHITINGDARTTAGQFSLEIDEGGAGTNRVDIPNLVYGDGAVVAIKEFNSVDVRLTPVLMGTATQFKTDGDDMEFEDILVDPGNANAVLYLGLDDGSDGLGSVLYNEPSDPITLHQRGGFLQLDHGSSWQDSIGDDGWESNLTIDVGYQGAIRLTVDEPDTGTNVNKLLEPILIRNTGETDFNAELRSQRGRNAAGTNQAMFDKVELEPGAIVRLNRSNCELFVNNLVMQGDGGILNNASDNSHLGNIDANGDGHTLTITSARHLRLFGVLDSSMTLRWDAIVAADNDNLELTDSNYGMPGEGFKLNGATLDANQGIIQMYTDPGVGTIEVRGREETGNTNSAINFHYGKDGRTWGDPDLVVNVYNDRGIRVLVEDAATGDPPVVNEINATINIMPGARVWFRSDRDTTDMPVSGIGRLNNLVLQEGAVFEARRDDNTINYLGGRVEGNATLVSHGADNSKYLTDWTGPGTLTVTGPWNATVLGTLDIGGLKPLFDDNTKRVIFDVDANLIVGELTLVDGNGGVQFNGNNTLTIGVAHFDSNAISFYDGMTATIGTANFNEPTMSFANNMNVALGTGNFNVDMDLSSLASLTIDHGVLRSGVTVTVTDVSGGTEQWTLGGGSELIANGTGTLDGATAIELTGATLTARVNGPLGIAAPVTVIGTGADAVLDIDRFDANGGTDQTITFASLILEDDTDNPVLNISTGSGYDVVFGSTTLDSGDRGQVNVITSGTDVDLGPVTITHGTLSLDAVAGARITVGPLDSGGDPAARLEFGRGGAYSGGDLVIGDSDPTKWNGTIYVDSATLVVDANFDGYDQGYNPTDPNNPSIIVGDLSKTIGTRAITEVTYDSSVEGMTMHEYATLGLKLSNTMKDVVAPMGLAYIWGLGDYGLIGGNLILNSDDIDASFRQSDGAGGSMNMTLIEDGWARVGYAGVYFTHATGIMSTLEDANYGAPLDLVGTIILGDPEGAGEDFEISGLIVDGYSPIEDMLWDYYGELMPGKLIKVGDEAVTLSRANTFTGGVDANEGTLVMADTLALGDITGPGLRLQGGTLRIAVADANFDAAAGGYAFSMTDDSTVEVNAAGANLKAVDLDNGTLVINNQMVGATAPSAGPGAGARTVINVPDVSIDYAVGLQGTLDVPASATIHNIEDFGASDANTLFQIGAGQTLTIDGDETLDDNRIWNVVGGATLLYSGDLTTAYTLRKAGAGTFTLAGANNSIASLIIGTSPGGTVIVTAAGKIPDSVLIEAGSLYTVQKDNHNYDEVAAASAGIAALSSGSNANVNFSDNAAYLGALGDYVFDGNMTPGAGGYFFGGGGGRLTVNDIMSNVPGPNTPATLGWADSHDNNVLFAEGVVLLNAENKLTGDVQVHMETIYLQKAFELVEPTDGNWVYVNAGGMLDLNSTGAREDNIMMNGGGLANTGGTLDANKMFPGPTGDYIIGSNSAGKTSWVDGGFVRANASLWKIGSDTAVLLDPIGGGDSNNTYAEDVADPNVIRGHTTIVGGTLEIYNTTSLAHTGALNIQNGSSLIMRSAGSLDAVVSLNGTLEIQDAGLLDLTDANAGLALAGTSLFAGGGTIELGAHTITGSGSLEIGDAGTVSTTINANSASDLFVIDEGSTAKLRWDGSFAKGLGTMYPGGTLQIESATGANARATHNTGKLIDLVVDEEAWLADRSGASSPANPYKIVVDGGGDGFFGTMNDWTVDRSGLLSTPAVVDDGNGLVHHPVAYIEKTGPGMLGIGGSLFGDANAIGGKAYWIVKEGDLGVIQMHASLGGTAGTWAIASGWTGGWGPDDVPYNTEIAYKNLEGIELYSGTSLTWAGPQGFLSDTVWRADPNYAHEPGDGWNPGEFIMENGSALYAGWIDGTDGHRGTVGNYDYLDLGIVDPQDANDVYLAYPSLRSTDANLPTVTFGGPGTLRLRSGVDANTLNANGSTYHAVIDGGRVEFSSDLPDALPADNIRTLRIMNAGTAALSHTHAAVTETTIEKFATLEFDANATTSYSGTVFSDGAVRVRTGQVDLGTTIIGSSPIGAAYDLIDGNFTGQYWGNQTETILKNVDWGALGDPNFTRGDAVVDFMNDASFNLQSGDPNMANDYFTVRWTVDVNVGADEAGLFEFWTDSDDASVVWVDDEIVVDNDGDHGPRTARGSVLLDEGIHTLVMGMHETAGGARARLGWNVYGVGDAIFDGNGVNLSGLINVDAGATLRLGGFNDAGVVTVDGNMVINGTAVSTAHELIINNGGVLDLGDGTISPVTNGTIRGTLLANGSLARFENVTIEGTSPAINLGTGLLRATNATVNSDFAFGVGVKSAFDTLAVNANVSVIPGGELAVSSMATISGGSKLSLSGGDTASLEAVMIDGGELEISDGNGLNSGMGVHNDGVVRITNGAVVDLTDVVITSSMSSGALPRATRLQAHWRFEDNLSDSSGNNRDGTMQGGAAVFVAGQVGQALSFDGTDDHVDIVGYPGVTGTQARTLSAWVQTSNNDTAFLGWGLNNNSEKWVFRVQTGNGTPGAIRVEVNGGYITGDTDIRGTGWRHVVAVLPDGSNNVDQVLLYLDGQLQGTSAVLSNPINTSAGGVVEIGNDVQNRYFGGLMDEVAIWDVALTPAQIQALYNWGGVIGNITVDAGSKLKVGGFTDAGTVTPAGTLELHNPLVTSTAELVAVPDGGVMDIRGSSLDANYGSLGGTLLGDGTALAKFRTRLTVEDATSPSINLGGGQLQVPGEVLVKKDNFAFDGGHVASIGTLNMEGPISVRIESTGNVSADLVNVGEAQTLVLKGGMLDPGRIENSNGHVHVQSGMNDLSDTVIHSPGGTLVPPVITGVDIGDSVAPGGSDTPIGGQWTDAGGSITGTGPDVWGGADDFHFVYREFDIDDDFDVRVDMSTFYGPGTNGWRKGGIMLRDSVADNSVYVAALGTPSNGTRIQWREGGSDSTPDSSNGHNNATSLRLVKNGTSFDAYHGTFGMDDWTLIASQAVTAWTNDTVLLGLWVTSHQDGVEATADFTNATLFAQDFYPVGTEIYGDLTIDSGAVLKLKGFTNAGTVQVGAAARLELGQYDSNCLDLELDPMGLIDVGQSLLIMRDGNTLLADVVGDIQTGRNGGGWDGANWVGGNWNGTAGITSSSLAGHEAEWSLAAFDPNTLNSDDEILVRLTIIGDVDLDEDVDEDDRAILEANFDQPGIWGDGDLDYSGVVDFRDYLLWKAFEGQEYDGPGSTIPEPATLVLLAFGGVAVLARRRRRK